MNGVGKILKTAAGLLLVGGLTGLSATATADVTVHAVDFGQSPGKANGCNSPLFDGVFDGTSGFVRMDISDCGVVESPSLDLGDGVTLSFTNVSGWNNTDGQPPESPQALTGDHFLTADLGADEVASFSVSGLNPEDILILEFADRRGGETALVTFEGIVTLVNAVPDGDGSGEFTDVSGGGVTGSSQYFGNFTGGNGSGQGNLAAARISIISAGGSCIADLDSNGEVNGADLGDFLAQWGVCADSGCTADFNQDGQVDGFDLGVMLSEWGCTSSGGDATGSCCFGEACLQLSAADCAAINGEYGGDDTVCDKETCIPPGPGPCCETNPDNIAGCIDLTCSYVVCLDLPDCCDVAWDANCATAALELCNDCNGTTDYTVAAIDFGQAGGCGPSPVFTGAFDGIDGFVGLTISDCCAVESPSIDLGNGVTFQFTDVSGWNNTDGVPDSSPQALTGDHFLTGCGSPNPVNFFITGVNPCDTVILEFADRRGGERALVTYEGVTTLIDSVPDGDGSGTFTDVSSGGLTGQTTYSGFFTGPDGDGEGNLAAARITIIPGDPKCLP